MTQAFIDYNTQINDNLRKIVTPIEQLGVKEFAYIKLFSNGSRLFLGTNLNWVNMYANYKLYNNTEHESLITKKRMLNEFLLWNSNLDKVFQMANSTDMWHGFMIYDGDEIFSFATFKENVNFINTLVENKAIFYHFISYFKDKIKHLIPDKKVDILLKCNSNLSDNKSQYKSIEYYETIIKKMPIKNYFLKNKNGIECKLSKREIEIIYQLASGKNFSEGAYNLSISSRTFEKHIERIKHKLSCYSKSNIIDLFNTSLLKEINFELIKKY